MNKRDSKRVAKGKRPIASVHDIAKARKKSLPQDRLLHDRFAKFLDLTHDREPQYWLQQLYSDGKPVKSLVGVHWGFEGLPGVVLDAEQCRAFGELLVRAADAMRPSIEDAIAGDEEGAS